ncbi:MAG: tetratricopeptide (TPR) repeat protein [Planctomycetota bacterium]|jgi:tetratricopeptide (TPR) repeat protein
MIRIRMMSVLALPFALMLASSVQAAPQDSREAMWPAPTKEDWAKPCLITFQRTWQDAIKVSEDTGRPILICVNMDGEIASEHYAGIRYRQPDKAALYQPYVCVMASVYRHNPRDYNEEGDRIMCPRFGSVTCGEHIAIEPVLHDQYFEETRVAPRHIMVELDKKEVYDMYYAFDTDSVFETIKKGIDEREHEPKPSSRDTLTLFDKVASVDIADRQAVEKAFKTGDLMRRRSILQTVITQKDVTQVDLLRLALFADDNELSRIAYEALVLSESPDAVRLIADVLNTDVAPDQRDELIGALRRLSAVSDKAKMLAVVYQGLASRSETLDAEQWSNAIESSIDSDEAKSSYTLGVRIEQQSRLAETQPDDTEAKLEFASSLLALAVHEQTEPRYAQLLIEDAHGAALEAEKSGAKGWRLHSVLAASSHRLGDIREAHRHARLAMEDLPSSATDWTSMQTLWLFAVANQRRISYAVRDKREWKPEWLADTNTAYTLLANHPLGTDGQVADHYDLLKALGVLNMASDVLDRGLHRFSDSWMLHDRFRGKVLAERGLGGFDGLENAYEEMLRQNDAPLNLEWFAGYASLVVAEFHRRGGTPERAHGAYERAVKHYAKSVLANPDNQDSADHYSSIAMAGQARLAMEREEWEQSVALILKSINGKPEAAATLDGLGLSAVATAQMLRSQLRKVGREDLADSIDKTLDALDPKLLQLPAFERAGPTTQQRQGQGGRRNRRGSDSQDSGGE